MHQPVVMAHGSLLMGIKSTAFYFPFLTHITPLSTDSNGCATKPDCRVISVVLGEEDHYNWAGQAVIMFESGGLDLEMAHCVTVEASLEQVQDWQTRWQMQWAAVIVFASRAASNLLMQIGVAVEPSHRLEPCFYSQKAGTIISVGLCSICFPLCVPAEEPAALEDVLLRWQRSSQMRCAGFTCGWHADLHALLTLLSPELQHLAALDWERLTDS